MKISLDEHGILEISHDDPNRYTWHNYSVMLNRDQYKELKERIEEYLECT